MRVDLGTIGRTAFVLGAAFGGLNCAVAGPDPVDPPKQIAVELPGGAVVTSFSYTVLGADGTPLVVGTQILGADAPLIIDLDLPPGNGDTVQIAATSSSGEACTGTSGSFNVVAGQPTLVSLTMLCSPASTAVDHCPTVASWAVEPNGDGAFNLSVAATDPDAGDLLSYTWSATAGTFSDTSLAVTSFSCDAAGVAQLTLTVYDNHTPSGCAATIVLPIECSAESAAP